MIDITTYSIRRISKNADLQRVLLDLTAWLDTDSWSQRMWHVTTGVSSRPLCPTCNKVPVNWSNPTKSYNTYCSFVCRNNNTKWKAGYRQTCLEKYGVDNARKASEVKTKIIKTKKKRYGNGNNTTKIKQTCLDRYGVDNVRKAYSVKQRIKKTHHDRYDGNCWLQANAGAVKNTIMERYGVDNYFKTTDFIEKRKQHFNANHGVDHQSQMHYGDSVLRTLQDVDQMYDYHITQQLSSPMIAKKLGIDHNTVLRWLKFHNITPTRWAVSAAEHEICEVLSDFGVSYEQNNRSIIAPYELDVIIPSLKIAIEYCGLYWHSDKHDRITKSYHYNKMEKCRAAGWRLITIFEDEWIHKRDLVEAKLKHICQVNTNKSLYARKCQLRLVSTKDKKRFFDTYHIQGNGKSSINVGLYNNNRLVCCIGVRKLPNNHYEINRYATSRNVCGGFGKLLKHTISIISPFVDIVTFADRRWSDGDLYHKLGFVVDRELPPDYAYVVGNNRIHKFNFRHKHLPTVLGDEYNSNFSEADNCKHIPRIWNCGLLRFVLTTGKDQIHESG